MAPTRTGPARRPTGRRIDAFGVLDYFRGKAITIPPMDGPLRPNNDLQEADEFLAIDAPDNLVATAAGCSSPSGRSFSRSTAPLGRRSLAWLRSFRLLSPHSLRNRRATSPSASMTAAAGDPQGRWLDQAVASACADRACLRRRRDPDRLPGGGRPQALGVGPRRDAEGRERFGLET